MKRLGFILGGLLLLLLATGVRWSQPTSAAQASPFEDIFIAPVGDKPVNNWRVCRDLGVGNVPGLGIQRQRFRLCHSQGWEVLVYCLEPNLPAPAVGTRCTRTNANTYWCGSGIQNLREYSIQETPIAVSTPTPTRAPTNTPTFAPTQTPTLPTRTPSAPEQKPSPKPKARFTPRAPTGGRSNFDLGSLLNLDRLMAPFRTNHRASGATPTPFQPRPPTAQVVPMMTQSSPGFYGFDLEDSDHRVRILIFPPNHKVNQGKPILISFIPGQTCNFGDNRGCINVYRTESGAPVTFISVHSGMGGEGQAFRNAVEGTGIDSAGLSLKEVRVNLRALDGAEVVIIQGKRRYEGFTLVAAGRIPPKSLGTYFKTPIQNALVFASTIDRSLSGLEQRGLPLLVFETCGWKMPGEPWVKGVTSTTASVYLGVIQKKP